MYLNSVDGFIFNSDQTRKSVVRLIGTVEPSVVATPGGDRLGATIPPAGLRKPGHL
jgi:hypothetical protein